MNTPLTNIAQILQQQANQLAEQVAIIDGKAGHERLTRYADLELQSAQFAAQLKSYGLKSGDVVLIFQPVSLELYVTLLAIFRLGLVAMFVDPSVGLDHLQRCCQRVSPDALIASSKAHLLRLVSPALRRIPIKIAIGFNIPFTRNFASHKNFSPFKTIAETKADTPALITFTSGSTGLPKAAVRTHGFLLAQHAVLEKSIDLKAGQVDVSTLPIFVLANLASGVVSLLCDVDLRFPGKVKAKTVLEQAVRFSATRCAASPAFFNQLVQFCKTNQITSLPFKRMDTGGAPGFPALLSALAELAPDAEVVAVYGSTEAEPIAHIHWRDINDNDRLLMHSGRGLLAGHPVAQIDLKIMADQTGTPIPELTHSEFEKQCLPMDVIGEIVVAGDHVLPGYLQGIGNEETKFKVDGRPWHRTGDAGYLDELGRLWLLGRCTARINDQHGELYPFAVETVVNSDASIKRSAMLAFKGQRYLLIESDSNIDTQYIKQQLSWARLDHVIQIEHIPVDKRHNAKIDYPALNEMLCKTSKSLKTLKIVNQDL